jgi:hypothetical protein
VSLHVWCQSKDLRLPVILTKDATRYLVLTGKMASRVGFEPTQQSFGGFMPKSIGRDILVVRLGFEPSRSR